MSLVNNSDGNRRRFELYFPRQNRFQIPNGFVTDKICLILGNEKNIVSTLSQVFFLLKFTEAVGVERVLHFLCFNS